MSKSRVWMLVFLALAGLADAQGFQPDAGFGPRAKRYAARGRVASTAEVAADGEEAAQRYTRLATELARTSAFLDRLFETPDPPGFSDTMRESDRIALMRRLTELGLERARIQWQYHERLQQTAAEMGRAKPDVVRALRTLAAHSRRMAASGLLDKNREIMTVNAERIEGRARLIETTAVDLPPDFEHMGREIAESGWVLEEMLAGLKVEEKLLVGQANLTAYLATFENYVRFYEDYRTHLRRWSDQTIPSLSNGLGAPVNTTFNAQEEQFLARFGAAPPPQVPTPAVIPGPSSPQVVPPASPEVIPPASPQASIERSVVQASLAGGLGQAAAPASSGDGSWFTWLDGSWLAWFDGSWFAWFDGSALLIGRICLGLLAFIVVLFLVSIVAALFGG